MQGKVRVRASGHKSSSEELHYTSSESSQNDNRLAIGDETFTFIYQRVKVLS